MAKGKKKAKNSDNASIFLRVLKLSKNQACMITFAIVFAAIAGSVLPTFGFLMAEQVSTMITEIDGDKMTEDCAQYSLFMFLLSFVMLVTFGATGFFQSTAGAAFTSKLRKKSFKSLLYQDMEYYDRSNKTNLALALANDTERAHKLIGPLFILVVMILFALLVGFVIGLNHNWRVSCVVMALVPFFAYGLIKR
jgi:ATP-binding cassette subfamily B (MDR/TAP) protein 1